MSELTEKIRSAIDLSEEAALGPVEKRWRVDGANSCQVYVRRPDYSTRTIAWCGNGHEDDFANVIHIAHHDPAAVLRQVAAHRKILDRHDALVRLGPDGIKRYHCGTCGGRDWDIDYFTEPCAEVLALAEAYGIEP